MKNKTLLYLIILCFFKTSCITLPPSEITKRFSYCYDGKYTGIDTLINITGYYKLGKLRDKYGLNAVYEHIIDTLYSNIIFFKDGIFMQDFSNDIDYLQFTNNTKKIKKIIKQTTIKDDSILYAYYHGRYIICGDTLKTQYINKPPASNPEWLSYETWYKIVDRNHIVYIGRKPLMNWTVQQKMEFEKKDIIQQEKYFPAFFKPLKKMPSSYCWLMEEEWFWCNKKFWEVYMNSLQKKK